MWSFHLIPRALDKVWTISDTKAGPSSDPIERDSPYLGTVSLNKALDTSRAHSVHVGKASTHPE